MAGHGPKGLVLARADEILTLGVIVARELFGVSIPVVVLDAAGFAAAKAARQIRIADGRVWLGETRASASEAQVMETVAARSDACGNTIRDIVLSEGDSALLSGARGEAAAVAMRIVLEMAALSDADELIDVSRAHIDGCIYTGPGMLAFAERLRDLGGRVAVPTTLNAVSVDIRRWRAQGIDPLLGEPAARLGETYAAMGARATYTCAPYLADAIPSAGEQIAWAESNAVVYANSVLGARTMKYPDFLDACIALTGRAPDAGCHRDEGRRAVLEIAFPALAGVDDAFFPLAGYVAGLIAGNRIPVVTGLAAHGPDRDALKAFGAAFATTSSAPMFHIAGVTPEAATLDRATGGRAVPLHALAVDDLLVGWRELNAAEGEAIDLVSIGNPHSSLEELAALAGLVDGRRKQATVGFVITCGRTIEAAAEAAGHLAALRRFGAEIVTDTCWCMVTEPLIPPSARTILTNSGKYAHYGPGLTGRTFRFAGLAACVEAACSGRATRDLPDG